MLQIGECSIVRCGYQDKLYKSIVNRNLVNIYIWKDKVDISLKN